MPFCDVNGIKLHYQLLGEGPLLTVIGGLGDSVRNWAAIAPQLARHFKVLLIDNRGAGLSERPQGPYRVATLAQDVVALWGALGIVKTHVLGFSMGGKIALHIALHHPEHLDKLVLVATTAAYERGEHPGEREIIAMLDGFENTPAHFTAQFAILFSERYKTKFSSEMFVKFRLADPAPQEPKDFAAQWAAVRDFDVSRDVSQITAPTLVLSGTEDRMTPYRNSEWLHRHIAGSKLILYPDVGHIPQAEETKKFLADVREFLL